MYTYIVFSLFLDIKKDTPLVFNILIHVREWNSTCCYIAAVNCIINHVPYMCNIC